VRAGGCLRRNRPAEEVVSASSEVTVRSMSNAPPIVAPAPAEQDAHRPAQHAHEHSDQRTARHADRPSVVPFPGVCARRWACARRSLPTQADALSASHFLRMFNAS
jgi:hypothetical protein